MGGKVSQVVHLDGVEVVLMLYEIHPLIEPFSPLLISLLTEIGDGPMVELFSMLICY